MNQHHKTQLMWVILDILLLIIFLSQTIEFPIFFYFLTLLLCIFNHHTIYSIYTRKEILRL